MIDRSNKGSVTFYSRTLMTVLCTGACGTAVGVLEALIFAPQDEVADAAVIDAGLVFPFGLMIAFALLPLLMLLFGRDPRSRIASFKTQYLCNGEGAAKMAAWSLVMGMAALLFFTATYHLAHIAVTRFHHPGLTALFIAVGVIGLSLIFGIAVARSARAVERHLNRHWSVPARIRIAEAAPFALPVFLLVAILISPAAGNGVLGFLGLLKRDELSLAYVWWALCPAAAATACYLFLTRRRMMVVTLAAGILCGIGVGATLVTATRYEAYALNPMTVSTQLSLGGRLLGLARSLFDRDDDGVSALFGGGDCDDSDPRRQPGAIDMPGNGLDEDCDGRDAQKRGAPAPAEAPADLAAEALPSSADLSLVMLTVDALRWDIGFLGYERPITPRIDELASRSVVFERAYALSSFTGRSLAPMFMGRYPSEAYCNFKHFTRYFDKNEMLAESLKAAGFSTAGIGSHFYFENESGLKQGFDRFFVEIPPGEAHIDQKVTSDLVARRAVDILSDPAFTRGRFFLWAHFMDPHRDYLPHPGFPSFGSKPRDLYDGEVVFTDHYVGEVIKAIDALGLGKRTIVMVTSDHGEAFNEHDIRYHGKRLWEEIVHVPWIWSIPGVAPKRVKTRVSQHDLAATVYELLRVTPPEQNRGRSLVPVIVGTKTADRRIFMEQPLGELMEEIYAVIDHGYKLIHTVVGNQLQLFDLDTDPGEKQNLAPSRPDKLKEMKAVYEEFRGGLQIHAPRR